MRYALYNRQMDLVDRLESEGKIFVIRPEIRTISRTERNRERLMEFYRHGYIQMMKDYDALKAYLEG
jgi:predicted patatin/cPLA2 family phospholipase